MTLIPAPSLNVTPENERACQANKDSTQWYSNPPPIQETKRIGEKMNPTVSTQKKENLHITQLTACSPLTCEEVGQ
ncbi:MAG: hypothetical protein AAF063_36230 [Cyanobacteria bacterium J06643_5]